MTSVNMARGFPGIAQNGWIEIKGTNLAPRASAPARNRLGGGERLRVRQNAVRLGSASMTVNGRHAFVYSVSATQLNVLVPVDNTLGVVGASSQSG